MTTPAIAGRIAALHLRVAFAAEAEARRRAEEDARADALREARLRLADALRRWPACRCGSAARPGRWR